jgi:hypothetical protein
MQAAGSSTWHHMPEGHYLYADGYQEMHGKRIGKYSVIFIS